MGAQSELIGRLVPDGPLGVHTSYGWQVDPKRICFTAARYKFVAKMLQGYENVLEVGCGDGFFSRIVGQHVGRLQAVDRDRASIASAYRNTPKDSPWRIWFNDWDIMKQGPLRGFDAVYSLDLFEHLREEDHFLDTLSRCAPLCIIGTPSLESQAHASEVSRTEHVNCKTKAGLREAMKYHFRHVFMFGMNDETLHTGIMSAYLFALGVNP